MITGDVPERATFSVFQRSLVLVRPPGDLGRCVFGDKNNEFIQY